MTALLEIRQSGVEIDRYFVRELVKYLNLLGATYILDFLPSDTIKNEIIDKARELKPQATNDILFYLFLISKQLSNHLVAAFFGVFWYTQDIISKEVLYEKINSR